MPHSFFLLELVHHQPPAIQRPNATRTPHTANRRNCRPHSFQCDTGYAPSKPYGTRCDCAAGHAGNTCQPCQANEYAPQGYPGERRGDGNIRVERSGRDGMREGISLLVQYRAPPVRACRTPGTRPAEWPPRAPRCQQPARRARTPHRRSPPPPSSLTLPNRLFFKHICITTGKYQCKPCPAGKVPSADQSKCVAPPPASPVTPGVYDEGECR